MYIQTCWQCAAKNEFGEEAGGARTRACRECGAELPTVGAPVEEEPWPARASSRPGLALARGFAELPLSYVLIAVNALFFALMVARGVSPLDPPIEAIFSWGADFGPATLGGEPWRLLTSMFMHIGVVHLALNMYALANVGPMTESLYGRAGFLALYLLSGVGGSLASIIWNPPVVSAGASGAVFGLFGGLLGVLLTQKSSFPADLARQHIMRIVAILAFNIFYGLTQPAINNAAHVGGLVTGLLFASAVRPDVGARRMWKSRQLVGVVVVLLALGLAWYGARRRVEGSSEARYLSLKYAAPRVSAQPGKQILYVRGATAEEARALGRGLEEKGFFKDTSEVTVLLARGPAGLEVSFNVRRDYLTDPQALKEWQVDATDLSADVFDRQPVKLHVCDGDFEPKQTFVSGSKLVIGENRKIYFGGEVTEDEARGLADALLKRGFGAGAEGAHIELSKTPEGYEVLFLVKEGSWDDPRDVAWFRALAAELSAGVLHGRPVTIQLSDSSFAPKKTIKP